LSDIPTDIAKDEELRTATSGTGLNASVRASTIINEVITARGSESSLKAYIDDHSTIDDLITNINALTTGEIDEERVEGLTDKVDADSVIAAINDSEEVTKINPTQIDTSSMAGVVPIGGMVDYFGTTAPTDWALLDGAEYDIATYPVAAALFVGIGSPGVGKFCVPDVRGYTTVMLKTGDVDFGILNTTKGAKTHQLTTTEMAGHTHTFTGSAAGAVSYDPPVMVDSATPGTHELPKMLAVSAAGTTDSTGGDTAHNNIQPSYVVNKIVRLK
jgi:microcystin-dependent protein